MKKQLQHYLYLALACSMVLLQVTAGQAAHYADSIYKGGTIYTMTETYEEALDDANAKTVGAVATKDGKVVFVGSWAKARKQWQGPDTRIVDLGRKVMLPGFVDPHGHYPSQGMSDLYEVNLNSPPLGSMTSIPDYIEALKARAEVTPPGEWVIGWGYDDTLLEEMRHPTALELDQVSTEHPIYIKHISGHLAVASTLAMDITDMKNDAGYATEVANGNVPLDSGTGEPTGLLIEVNAMGLVSAKIPAKTEEQGYRGVQRAADVYASAGVTTADQGSSIIGFDYGSLAQDGLAQMQEVTRRGKQSLRVVLHPIGRYGVPDLATYIRQALGWTGTETIDGITFTAATPGPDSPETGDDVSNYLNTGTLIPEGILWLGSWKLIFDGSNQGYTGWFKTPGYYLSPEGEDRSYHAWDALNFSPESMKAIFKLLHKYNQGVEVHGNGNAAVEQIVTAMEEATAEYPTITDRRHTIIHSQMAERQHVERMMGIYDNLKPEFASMYGYPPDGKLPDDAYMLTGTYLNGVRNEPLIAALNNGQLMRDQNLVNSYYVAHTYYWGDRHRDIFMGPGRAKNMSPSGWSMYQRNIFNYHSDTPVVPMQPLRSLQAGVTRVSSNGNDIFHTGKDYGATIMLPETKGGVEKPFWNYDQRANRLMALRALTVHGAFPTFLEGKVGSITPGSYADFVILDSDPMTVPALTLADIRVVTTLVNDEVVYGYLPGAADYTGRLMGSYLQVDDVSSVNTVNAVTYSEDEARSEGYALPDSKVYYTIKDFESTLTGEASNGVLQFQVFGNGDEASSFTLANLAGPAEYQYGRPGPDTLVSADGYWWFAPLSDPNLEVAADEILENNAPYTLHFVLSDNGAFDQDTGLGVLKGAVALIAGHAPSDDSAHRKGKQRRMRRGW